MRPSTSSASSPTTCGPPSPRSPRRTATVRQLFALDHNFPDPIVEVLADFQADAELVRIDQIDARMPDLDDWQLCSPCTTILVRGTD